MHDMYKVVSRVELLEVFFGGRVAGNRFARATESLWSRATAYRKLNKAEQLGLVERERYSDGDDWRVTEKGKEFAYEYDRLPY